MDTTNLTATIIDGLRAQGEFAYDDELQECVFIKKGKYTEYTHCAIALLAPGKKWFNIDNGPPENYTDIMKHLLKHNIVETNTHERVETVDVHLLQRIQSTHDNVASYKQNMSFADKLTDLETQLNTLIAKHKGA